MKRNSIMTRPTKPFTISFAELAARKAAKKNQFTRVAFEFATDAELLLCASSAGVGEVRVLNKLLDQACLTKGQRTNLITFLNECGYASIQIDPERRIFNSQALVDFEIARPMEEEPNLDTRHRPDRAQALAFLNTVGLYGARLVHGGSNDMAHALYECNGRSARQFIKKLTVGFYQTHGLRFTKKANAPTWGNGKKEFIEVAEIDGQPMGFIEIIVIGGQHQTARIKFTNYAE
jgi:hypothetical protein